MSCGQTALPCFWWEVLAVAVLAVLVDSKNHEEKLLLKMRVADVPLAAQYLQGQSCMMAIYVVSSVDGFLEGCPLLHDKWFWPITG